MKQLIEGETVGDDVTLWGAALESTFYIQWGLVGADAWVADVTLTLRFLVFRPTICSFELYCFSTLPPYCYLHLEPSSPFLTQNLKLYLRVNFSRQSCSRAFLFEVYCILSVWEGRGNLKGHRKVRVRNIHMGVLVPECGCTPTHILRLYPMGLPPICLD